MAGSNSMKSQVYQGRMPDFAVLPATAATPDLTQSGTDCVVSLATTARELEGLKEFWRRANVHPDADADFYSLFTSLRREFIRPFVLAVTQNGCPRALLIGRLEDGVVPLRFGYFTLFKIPVRQITFLQEGLLGDTGPEVARALIEKVAGCLKAGIADRASLSNVNVESHLYGQAKMGAGVLMKDYAGEVTYHWRTRLPETFDEFLNRRSKKHRYWLRRIVRVFEADHKGRVEYKVVTGENDLKRFCGDAEAIARNTYQRGLGVGFSGTEEIRRRLQLAAQKGWLKAYTVCADGKPLAFWAGRLYKGVMYLEWTGYDPAFRKYELGTVLFLKMAEDLCRSGVKEIDYGAGAAFYKERFGDCVHQEALVSLNAPSMKGVCISVLKTFDAVLNRSARALAQRLKIADRVKKLWRGRLAGRRNAEMATEDCEPERT